MRVSKTYLKYGNKKVAVSLDKIDIIRKTASPQFVLKGKIPQTLANNDTEIEVHVWTSGKITNWAYDRFNHGNKIDMELVCDNGIKVKVISVQITRINFHEGDIADMMILGNQLIMDIKSLEDEKVKVQFD